MSKSERLSMWTQNIEKKKIFLGDTLYSLSSDFNSYQLASHSFILQSVCFFSVQKNILNLFPPSRPLHLLFFYLDLFMTLPESISFYGDHTIYIHWPPTRPASLSLGEFVWTYYLALVIPEILSLLYSSSKLCEAIL